MSDWLNPNTGNYEPSGGGMNWGAAIGDLFGGIGSFIGNSKWKNPADASKQYLDQIPGTVTPLFQPYINSGNQALPKLQDQYNQILANPGQFFNNLGNDFQKSPGFDFQVKEATGAANRAAAAGGMLGTPEEQANLAERVSGIANQDYYNWMDHIMKIFGMGIGGENNLAEMGQRSSSDLASALTDNLNNQANLAYAGQDAENKHPSGWQSAFNTAGNVINDLFG